MNLASYIDHTILKAQAEPHDIEKLCDEAIKHSFAAVCVNPVYVELAAKRLKGSAVKVATVVGFPLGATTSEVKVLETKNAITLGAQEIDMVMSIGRFLAEDTKFVANEIGNVVKASGNLPVKVIIETCYLSLMQIELASKIACDEGAAFVKTSTGFGTRGATVEDINTIRETVGDKCLIKAAGGIRTREQALAMISAGASRIGTSSGVEIVSGENK